MELTLRPPKQENSEAAAATSLLEVLFTPYLAFMVLI